MKRLVKTSSFVAIASGKAQLGYPPQSATETFINEIIALVRNETNYEALFQLKRLQETCYTKNEMGEKCIRTAFRH